MRSKADFRISANQKLIQSKESIGYERIFVGQKPKQRQGRDGRTLNGQLSKRNS